MSVSETYVRARIDEETKVQATDALAAMGLTVSDALRMMLRRVAAEGRLPFEVRTPNRETRAALGELKAGKGKRFKTARALLADLNAND